MRSAKDMTADELWNEVAPKLLYEKKKESINNLLAGNDTQCFTTVQYAKMYAKLHWKGMEEGGERMMNMADEITGETLAHRHLRQCKLVKEVKPDVWTTSR